MKEIVFSLEGAPYIELDKLLKLLRLVESGGQGLVTRGGTVETRKRAKLRPADCIELQGCARVLIAE